MLKMIKPLIEKKELNFTQFLMEAIREYIRMLHYVEAVNTSFGAWKDTKHKELRSGSYQFIRNLRRDRKR
jgi:hypothetical protein